MSVVSYASNDNILPALEGMTIEFRMFHDNDDFEPITFAHVVDKTGWDGVLNEAAIQLAHECAKKRAKEINHILCLLQLLLM